MDRNEFVKKFRTQLGEVENLLDKSTPDDGVLESLRRSFKEAAVGAKVASMPAEEAWPQEARDSWREVISFFRREVPVGFFSWGGRDYGHKTVSFLVGWWLGSEIRRAAHLRLLEDRTGVGKGSYSSSKEYEAHVRRVLESARRMEGRLVSGGFLGALEAKASPIEEAISSLEKWLSSRDENRSLEEDPEEPSSASAFGQITAQPAALTPDPRAQLTADLEKAKAQKAEALANEDADALKEAWLGPIDSELEAALAKCKVAPENSPLFFTLSGYQKGKLGKAAFLKKVAEASGR